jgi:hypothetical protein
MDSQGSIEVGIEEDAMEAFMNNQPAEGKVLELIIFWFSLIRVY